MKKQLIGLGAAALMLGGFGSAGATIISGDLTLNDSGSLITATDGTTYVGWTEVHYMDYAQTMTATSIGGTYEAFHIASQTEAYQFLNFANINGDIIDIPGGNPVFDVTTTSETVARFGDTTSWSNAHYAFFLSDETNYEVGYLSSSSNYLVSINDQYTSITSANNFSNGQIGWLLVSDTSAPIPEPATMILFGTGLLGLVGSRIRRKKK